MRATKAIIYLDNFRENLGQVKKRAGPGRRICVPVKADAYGHGAVRIAETALAEGAYALGVATVGEGAELRRAGIRAPVLLFSQALGEELGELVSLDLTPFVSDPESIDMAGRAAALAGKTITAHLKIDTGMGRMGCRPEEAADLARRIGEHPRLLLGGTATHLAVSDSWEAEDRAYTKAQLGRFQEALSAMKAAGLDPGIIHAANSGALVFHEDALFDMVRPGIFLYGYSPAGGSPLEGELPVKPVMEVRSALALIKRVRKGESLSYGRTWTASEDTVAGVLPIGYADGLPRLLSNKHRVLIQGRFYPIVGRICMDQCLVNLGPGSTIPRWEEAVVFGPGAETAAGMARQLGTISYEITCGVNKRVPRIYQ
ncbi:MAG: alanine racemase [Treponema sp.]|nr:alanine racemase [Treponema sp.]